MLDNIYRFEALPDREQAQALLSRIVAACPYIAPPVTDKPVYLYGAGNLGRLAWDYLKKIGQPVAAVIDQNAPACRLNPFWANARLLSPDEVTKDVKRDALLAICIVTQSWEDVTRPLHEAGWRTMLPFYTLCLGNDEAHPLDNGWLTGSLTDEDQAGMVDVLNRFADDTSRAHLLQFAAWHTLQQEWIFSQAPVTAKDRYFIPEIVPMLHDHEYLADLGAYQGQVTAEFIDLVHGSFAGICAFEPDTNNAAEFEQYLETIPPKTRVKIRLERVALGQEAGHEQFVSGLGYVSRRVAQGGTTVAIDTLDRFELSPTFIKAHLEGGELDALLGGLKTIHRCRPIIALTVYHNRLGLWEVAKRLMDELEADGYGCFFRLHGWHGTGAVLYLIPENRM
jgi:FkbM family methyltransferase